MVCGNTRNGSVCAFGLDVSSFDARKTAARCRIASRPSPGVDSMKAIRMHTQGGPELLAYEDAPKPSLQPGDALVRVIATSITKTELTWDETYRDCDGRPRIPT